MEHKVIIARLAAHETKVTVLPAVRGLGVSLDKLLKRLYAGDDVCGRSIAAAPSVGEDAANVVVLQTKAVSRLEAVAKTVTAITTAMIPESFSMAPQATLALRAARGS